MPSTRRPVLPHPGRAPFLALARYPAAAPLAAIAAGTLAPGAAAAAHAALPATVPLLVFLAVLATEVTPPTRQEAGTALPALAAFAARRMAPGLVAPLLPALGGSVVLALLPLGLLAGGGLTLAVAGSAQNVSFAWAACVGALPPRSDLVFATAFAATIAMPGARRLVLAVAGRHEARRPRAVAAAPAADSGRR